MTDNYLPMRMGRGSEDFERITWFQGEQRGHQSLLRECKGRTREK